MSHWRTLCLLLCLVLLSACSSTTFVYNRLDFFLPWYVSDYADLNTQQDAYLDARLKPFLDWHRNQELPVYIDIIDGMEARLDKPVSGEDIAEIFAEFEAAYLRLEDESLEWLLDLGEQLSDEQIDDFVETLWDKQTEFQEKYLERSDEEFYEESFENFVDNSEEFLGRLSDEQREQLRVASDSLLRSDEAWLKERADWLKKLEVMLAREPGWQESIKEAVATQRENLPEDYVRIYEHNMNVIFAAIAELLSERSAEQDEHLRERFAELRADFETLVAQGQKEADSLEEQDSD